MNVHWVTIADGWPASRSPTGEGNHFWIHTVGHIICYVHEMPTFALRAMARNLRLAAKVGGRYWIRTSDFLRVMQAL